ncbi:MAG: 4Fe-4S dicluster domain-containing protein [Chromatiales bacterium]|nr:4Fe-4S dicluster domain-containing protein [Chromatiales bacterium]
MDRAVSHGSDFLSRDALGVLLQQLRGNGYRVVGPQPLQGTILYRDLHEATQLPWGWRDTQQPGSYRLQQEGSRAFAWANGPQGIKPLTFAPQESLWRVEQGMNFQPVMPPEEKLALIGVRSCDLAALALQDRHFSDDSHFARHREGLLLIAVNCTHPAETCFCAATGDGPNVTSGYDLLLDELDEGFIVNAGSEAGEALLVVLPLQSTTSSQQEQLLEQQSRAVRQSRDLPGHTLPGGLADNPNHPRWQQVADRCLACGNCTAVCPTCFCHSEHDVPRLDGSGSEHVRQWASCFDADHSILHGIPVRAATAQRYRQWLTHKFDHWHQQYGRSGCVGCGRCITWCPVGIDVTEELAAICGGGA